MKVPDHPGAGNHGRHVKRGGGKHGQRGDAQGKTLFGMHGILGHGGHDRGRAKVDAADVTKHAFRPLMFMTECIFLCTDCTLAHAPALQTRAIALYGSPNRIEMNIGAVVHLICLPHMTVHAASVDQDNVWKDVMPPFTERHLLRAPFATMLSGPAWAYRLPMFDEHRAARRQRPAETYARESTFARAIARSFRKTAPEKAIEAATRIIVMCQKEQNPALTTPFFRSDSQQAHCFRY